MPEIGHPVLLTSVPDEQIILTLAAVGPQGPPGGGGTASVTSSELSALEARVSALSGAGGGSGSVTSTELSNAISVRVAAENALSQAISVLSQGLSVEAVARSAGSVVLSQSIAATSQALSVETAARITKDDSLSQAISIISASVSVLSATVSPLATRGNITLATSTLSVNATENGSVAIGKAGQMIKVTADRFSRVRLYKNASARTSDLNRKPGSNPSLTAGVICDLVFDSQSGLALDVQSFMWAQTETSVTPNIPYAVQNRSSSIAPVSVVFTRLLHEL